MVRQRGSNEAQKDQEGKVIVASRGVKILMRKKCSWCSKTPNGNSLKHL